MNGSERQSNRWRVVVAALLVAAGQLAAAWLAATEEFWSLVMAPVLMALTVVGAGFYLKPLGGRRVVRAGLIMAVALLAASAFVAHGGAHEVRDLVPVIGGSTGGMVVILAGVATARGGRVC